MKRHATCYFSNQPDSQQSGMIVHCWTPTFLCLCCPAILHYATHTSLLECTAFSYSAPLLAMVGGLLYLMPPLLEPQSSIDLTTPMEAVSPGATWPKTTWRPSNQEVTTVVTKNCEPLVLVTLPEASTVAWGPSQVQSKKTFMTMLADDAWKERAKVGWLKDLLRSEAVMEGLLDRNRAAVDVPH